MTRWKLTVEYDGGPFVGWQRQTNGPSVQQALEEAVHAFAQEWVTVQGAGRTDAGVHALGQVAHVDIEKPADAKTVRDALNHHMKAVPVVVRQADAVDDAFHARFSATGRAYLYRIVNRRPPPALDQGRVWHVGPSLDLGAMSDGAARLLGRHDFSSFRAAECQADSPVKTLDRLDVVASGEEIHLIVEARSFLHHQVRNFAGTLKRVGEGYWQPADVTRILEARDRRQAGPTAPAHGLYLTRVDY